MKAVTGNLIKLIKETQSLSYQWFRLKRKFDRVGQALSAVEIDLKGIKRLQEEIEILKLQVGLVTVKENKRG